MKRKKIATEDGSHSFYVAELDEQYHSRHGAIQESQHVFIDAGFRSLPAGTAIRILEMGFGTGLNALLTIITNQKRNNEIRYDAIEAFPLTMKEVEDLNYTEISNAAELRPVFIRMHDCNWGNPTPVYKNFILTKYRTELQQFHSKLSVYDLIYFDAFAPKVQPELWTGEIFESMYNSLKKNGILVTYCAKGSVKRALKAAGFQIESIPGPKGKREMTRAVK